MCGCERHWDPAAPCACQCNHKEDVVAGENLNAGDALGIDTETGKVVIQSKTPRLKRYIYKHTHECQYKNELFTYYPHTTGAIMFPIHPVCIEAETELMLVRIEDA